MCKEDTRFFDEGLRFQCKRCSACCRLEPGIVSLTKQDLDRLVSWARMERDAFIKAYCRRVTVISPSGDEEERLCLKEKENYDCILWSGGCLAYEARPIQCETYPFWPSILQSRECWEKEAQSCPGINSGQLYSKEQILSLLKKRVNP